MRPPDEKFVMLPVALAGVEGALGDLLVDATEALAVACVAACAPGTASPAALPLVLDRLAITHRHTARDGAATEQQRAA